MSEDAITSHRLLIEACLQRDVPFFWRGPGTLLIAGTGAQDVLRDIASAGARVLGVEGFELESTEIHPRIDLIFTASRRPHEDPVSVVATWGDEVWVAIAIRPPEGTSVP
jgi:hypothetical protein